MPAERDAVELAVLVAPSLIAFVPFVTGDGIGGADCKSHFRCVIAPLRRS